MKIEKLNDEQIATMRKIIENVTLSMVLTLSGHKDELKTLPGADINKMFTVLIRVMIECIFKFSDDEHYEADFNNIIFALKDEFYRNLNDSGGLH